jgi:hypothetical protein
MKQKHTNGFLTMVIYTGFEFEHEILIGFALCVKGFTDKLTFWLSNHHHHHHHHHQKKFKSDR